MNEEVALREMIRHNQRIDFGTHPFVAISKRKEQPGTTAEIFAGVIETIKQEVAIEEAEIPAEVIQYIGEEVAIKEMVVVIEPEEQAKAEGVTKSEGVTVVNRFEVGSGMIAMEGVIPDISEQSTDAAIKEVVVVIELKEQAMAEIPTDVIQPIEEKVAMEELVVVVKQERQSMEECQQRPSVMAEIPAEVVLAIQPIEEEVATEEVGVIQPIEEKVAMKELVVVVEPKEQVMEGVTVVNPVEVGSGMIAIEGVILDINEQSADEQSGVKVITTAPIEAEAAIKEVVVITEPNEQAMEVVNVVKYEELVLAEEHITIIEIELKDTADNIDASNSCTCDCMMNLTGYDPGGGITDIVTAHNGVCFW